MFRLEGNHYCPRRCYCYAPCELLDVQNIETNVCYATRLLFTTNSVVCIRATQANFKHRQSLNSEPFLLILLQNRVDLYKGSRGPRETHCLLQTASKMGGNHQRNCGLFIDMLLHSKQRKFIPDTQVIVQLLRKFPALDGI